MPKIGQLIKNHEVLDFAIVGGGIAGAYLAWRLTGSKCSPSDDGVRNDKTQLFEGTDRMGGRLLTRKMPGMDFLAELGGMRYTGDQILLRNLVRRLNLREIDFSYSDRLRYLRGRHLVVDASSEGVCANCNNPIGLPYRLEQNESREPVLLAKQAIASALKKLTFTGIPGSNTEVRQIQELIQHIESRLEELNKRTFTCRQWELIKRYGHVDGLCLQDLGFWNLLHQCLSHEGFLLLHDALGYESIFANWNAAEAIPWFLADFGVKYFTLEGGLDQVATHLATWFQGLNPNISHFGYFLKSIEEIDDSNRQRFVLTFDNGRHIFANNVVLAFGKESLKRVDLTLLRRNNFDPDREFEIFRQIVDSSVTAHPLFKLFLAYDQRWWTDSGILGQPSGRATTDLPIRQVYYYDSPQNDAVIMGSYSDEHYVDFWKPFRIVPGSAPHHPRPAELDFEDKNTLRSFGVTKNMLLRAHAQVSALHPNANRIPEPLFGLFRDWSDAPFFGGWHSWNPQVNAYQVADALVRPFPGVNLFTCGEAFSSEQGWVEGALKSAELVLKHLNVDPPGWVEAREYEKVRCEGHADYIRS